MSQQEIEAAKRYLAASIAAGRTRVQRSAPQTPPIRGQRKNGYRFSMTPDAVRMRARRGRVI